jgi:hypothetical protein
LNSTYLSDTKSKTRGIGAAQQWVKSEFDKYALESNGRLTSKIDYFTIKQMEDALQLTVSWAM